MKVPRDERTKPCWLTPGSSKPLRLFLAGLWQMPKYLGAESCYVRARGIECGDVAFGIAHEAVTDGLRVWEPPCRHSEVIDAKCGRPWKGSR